MHKTVPHLTESQSKVVISETHPGHATAVTQMNTQNILLTSIHSDEWNCWTRETITLNTTLTYIVHVKSDEWNC